MRNKLMYIAVFAAGVGVGAGVTWKVLKDKYAKLAQEEIESVKEVFKNNFTKTDYPEEDEEESGYSNKEDNMYKSTIGKYNYSTYSEEKKPEVKEVKNEDEPYVISPNDFGELDDYECITLFYYNDGVLADDRDEIVDNANDMVGRDFAEHFGDYEDDSVFIRNDSRRCDYEILLDGRNFSEVGN